MITETQVLDSLRHIIDPDLGRDIVSLGFVKNMRIDGGSVQFTVELTTPACPVKEQFRGQCVEAVQKLDGVERVNVDMTSMQPKKRASAEIDTLKQVATIIAVSSCKGGVGKSTVAAHLARAMRREGLAVGLLDADVYGPSIPTLFRKHNPQIGMRNNLLIPAEVDGLKLMSLGFLIGEQPAVLRGPIVSGYIQQILHQTDWGKLDYLVIDLPPGTGDIQLTIVQTVALDGAIIVTTPQALSLVDVARGILMFEKVSVPVLGLVENMSYFVCDNCSKKHYIFGSGTKSLKDRFGLTTLAELPISDGFASIDSNTDTLTLDATRQLAENVHREIGKRRVDAVKKAVATVLPEGLRVEWPEGGDSLLPNRAVRMSCRCARCVNEMTGAQILQESELPQDLRIEAIQPLGNYAVGIIWSDGHSTGIHSWELLRALAKTLGV